MGLYLLIFKHEEWKKFYSDNCSLRSIEDWNAEGTLNYHLIVDVAYIFIGVVCQLMYIPFIFVMLKPKFIQHSCYKFMFLLATIDMIALPCDSFISGIQGVLGYHYCTNPFIWYLVGCGSIAGYLGATMTCIMLAIDRFFVTIFPHQATQVFGGNRVYLWMLIPLGYILFTLTQIPAFYSIKAQAFYYDPYWGTPGYEGNPYFHQLAFLVTNSVLTVVFMGGTYTAICIAWWYKTQIIKSNTAHMTKLQRIMLFQSMAICIEMFVVAVVYVSNQFFPSYPPWVVKIEHFTWICVHGDTPIVYLMLNASLRKSFLKMIKETFKKKPNSVVFMNRMQSHTPT